MYSGKGFYRLPEGKNVTGERSRGRWIIQGETIKKHETSGRRASEAMGSESFDGMFRVDVVGSAGGRLRLGADVIDDWGVPE